MLVPLRFPATCRPYGRARGPTTPHVAPPCHSSSGEEIAHVHPVRLAESLQGAEGGIDGALLQLLVVAGVDLRGLRRTLLAPAHSRSGLPEAPGQALTDVGSAPLS